MKILVCLLAMAFGALTVLAANPDKLEKTGRSSATAEALAKTLTAEERAALLALLNQGDQAALEAIPGVGEARANAIRKARPFAEVANVTKVDGVGEGIFAKMVAHAKAGFPPGKGSAGKKKAPAKTPAAPGS